jgi:peptidoglycan/xylan/chitin deacetylase (PgdA/CDA1 family)
MALAATSPSGPVRRSDPTAGKLAASAELPAAPALATAPPYPQAALRPGGASAPAALGGPGAPPVPALPAAQQVQQSGLLIVHGPKRLLTPQLLEPKTPVTWTRAPIKITFDQPIGNHKMVEDRLQVRPAAAGRVEWPDDHTLAFTPDHLEYDTSYTVAISGMGRADLADPADRWEWTFKTIKPITLTFDDCGRSAPQFDQMLDTIRAKQEQGYRVMFFPTGQCRAQYPRQFARMAAMAPVCNHTYSHPRLTKLSDAGIKAEIAGGNRVNCDLMRPPWGDWDGPGGRVERIANAQGFRIQMWDVETYDWQGASSADILAAIRAQGGIVLLHLNGYHTVEALREL